MKDKNPNRPRPSRERRGQHPQAKLSSLSLGLELRYDAQGEPHVIDRETGEPLPERCQQILWESLSKSWPDLAEGWAEAGGPGAPDLEEIQEWRRNYEKAYYGKLRQSQKGREAVNFLRHLRIVCLLEAERAETDSASVTSDSEQAYEQQLLAACEETFTLLELLLNALPSRENPDRLDVKFLKALAEAADLLERRLLSCKQAKIGSGDLHLDKWLLEYKAQIPRTGAHTVRELNERFVSKFRAISDHKLREKCRALGVPVKPDARGAAAVKYRSNRSAHEEKRTN